MTYCVIENQHKLEELVVQIQEKCPASLPIDLEFVRRETYYPQLSLVQLLVDSKAYIIDYQAEGVDIEPLREILKNQAIVKIFHSGRQDIEIFFNILKCIPTPLFDTQITEMFLSPVENQPYHALVQKYTGAELDKSQQTIDWGERPLSDKAYQYAADDVVYLESVYKEQISRLQALGFLSWVQEEMEDLENEQIYISDPLTAWKKVKLGGWPPSQLFLGKLQILAQMREEIAAKINRPKTRILIDSELVRLAKQENTEDIVDAYQAFGHLVDLEELKKRLEDLKTEDCPLLPQPPEDRERFQKQLKIMKEKRDKLAVTLGMCPTLLANNKDLEVVVAGREEKSRLLKGWRKNVWESKIPLSEDAS